MSRRFVSALCLALLAPLPAAAASFGSIHSATWMTQGAATLGARPLNTIAIPAAHDAATYSINTGFTSWTTAHLAPDVPDNKRATMTAGRNLGVTGQWAKAQTRTTAQMLDDGIRYLDIRVCIDAKGDLLTCHSLYGDSIANVLAAVKTFTEQNPREVVLLGFNHFWDASYPTVGSGDGHEGLTDAHWLDLRALITSTLQGRIAGNKYSPTSTLNDLWAGAAADGSTNQVIVLYATSKGLATPETLIWSNKESAPWSSKTDMTKFLAAQAGYVANQKAGDYAGKFWGIRSSVTPDTEMITRGFARGLFPTSLEELAAQTNPVVLAAIKSEWSRPGQGNINLIWADHYDKSELVKLALYLNQLISAQTPFASDLASKISKWGNWNCPTDFTDNTWFCAKPPPYLRGAGYPWKLGDKLGSLDEARARCASANPGGCEKNGEIIYPKCRSGFHAAGSNICSPDCPAGMKDIGVSCQK